MRYLSFQVEYIEEENQLLYNVFVDLRNRVSEKSVRNLLSIQHFESEGHVFTGIPTGYDKLQCKNRAISAQFRVLPRPFGQHGQYIHTFQGQRTEVEKAVEVLKERGWDGVVRDYPQTVVKYPRGLKEISLFYLGDLERRGIPEDTPMVHIWWGVLVQVRLAKSFVDTVHLQVAIFETTFI